MKQKDQSTEETILQAARKAFTKKGLSGARMQDIADESGINKALVHYYFESKEKLFALVFEQEFGKLFSNLAAVVSSDLPLFEKIEQIVAMDFEKLSQFPDLPLFVINEVSRNPAMVVKRFRQLRIKDMLGTFQNQIDHEIKNGTIKSISATQLLINIQSLSIFPFVSKPMVKNLFKMSEKNYKLMMQLRKKEVAMFIINALKIKN
ncbi:MAG: TetR/AcrR family transcriptional regulator [Ferruginibacter sp.]